MAHTFQNDDGVLVVDSGPVALESATDMGEATPEPEQNQEVPGDVDGPGAGE